MNRLSFLKTALVSSVAAMSFAGCATLSPNDLGETLTADAAVSIPNNWLLDVPATTARAEGWAALYDDPTLLDYLKIAEVQNYDLRIARARVTAAEADLKRANTRLSPQISGSASAGVSAVVDSLDDPFDSYGLGLSGRWDPDIFGQTQTIIDGSRAALKIAEASEADTRQIILAQTARAYIRAVEAELQAELAKVNLDFLTESRRISEARYRAGDSAKGDFSFAEANYQSALASYENTLQSARAAKRALSIVLGDYPVNDLQLASVINTPRQFPSRALPASVLEARPDIIAARAQIAARVASLRSNELSYWPDIGITGGLSSGSAFSDLFDPGDYVARLGASLGQVIFDGGAIEAGIDAAKADLDSAVLSYEQRLRRAMGEITDAYDRAETLQRTLVNQEAASTSANEALRLASLQYDLGESSLLEVLQVQTRVNSIDAGLIRTKAALIETLIIANQAVAGFERI
ncbi:TolC family protein [Fretibacter rubidus]|uniref:TolC family protein n=1 Tax=Fretibacter rubidus TaxID=570162 RepID=UPI00352AF039